MHEFARIGNRSIGHVGHVGRIGRIGRVGRIGRIVIVVGSAVWILAGLSVSAGPPLSLRLDASDSAAPLTVAQREAARALGEARRLISEGKTAEAREALERTTASPALAGYAEWVRVHLLMKEGSHRAAHRAARDAGSRAKSGALRAALAVVEGEALAKAGDASAAELAWNSVLDRPAADDEAVRNSIRLAIIASRQRTGSLDPAIDPRVLLERTYTGAGVTSTGLSASLLAPPVALAEADAALQAGRMEQAIVLFDVAIAGKLDPEKIRVARMGRGRALFRARQYESASEAFRELLPDLEASFWLARTFARLSDVEESLAVFERVSRGSDEEFASRALYLMGTLHEDRGEMERAIGAYRRAAGYERFPERARAALWREGWAQFRIGKHGDAQKTFSSLVARLDDPLEALRPRYWSARAAGISADEQIETGELDRIAREYPLTYYGWRAQERLSLVAVNQASPKQALVPGTRRVDEGAIERATLLIEAGLSDLARDELRFAARRAGGLVDRTRVAVLLAQVGDYHRSNRLVIDAYADLLARGLQPGHEALWWLAWPPAYRETIKEMIPVGEGEGEGEAIEPELVLAIMREESHYRVDARSVVGALGLLQIMPATANQLAREKGLDGFETEDLFDPRINIMLGSTYLLQLGNRFEGRMSAVIGSYNAGPNRVASWLRGEAGGIEDDIWVENIPYDQTRGYVKRVLRSLHAYKVFYRSE